MFPNGTQFKSDSEITIGEKTLDVIDGVILLQKDSGYVENFSLQWQIFSKTQLDGFSGLNDTEDRLSRNIGFPLNELEGKVVLELGSGPGRFTEIFKKYGAHVISLDYSDAIFVNAGNTSSLGSSSLYLKGSLFDLNPKDINVDLVFCYGVIQHTPNPLETIEHILKCAHNCGARVSVDVYRKFYLPSVWSFPKYFWRPITRNMNPKLLYKIIKSYMPIWLPIDTGIRRIPYIGVRILGFLPIPCWNYLDKGLTYQQRLHWAIMDTFDALGAKFDYPFSHKELQLAIDEVCDQNNIHYDFQILEGSNGYVANNIIDWR